jgi:hypothetical protein
LQAFRSHLIDGAALLLLQESHLSEALGLRLGTALRLRSAVAEAAGDCAKCGHCQGCHKEEKRQDNEEEEEEEDVDP